MSKFSFADQFISSVKNIFVKKNTARSIYYGTEPADVKDNKVVDKNDTKI